MLGLATTGSEDADYENLNVDLSESKLNISHSRSRSLRHSGDFSRCWMLPLELPPPAVATSATDKILQQFHSRKFCQLPSPI